MSVDIEIETAGWRAVPGLEQLARRAALACRSAGDGRAITIVFTDDAAMRELNRTWRGKDSPTNVLSFPASTSMPLPADAIAPLGDIILGYETSRREAEAQGKTLTNHAAHLITHGILHLLGYDHETEDDAVNMENKERAILAALGIKDPYLI